MPKSSKAPKTATILSHGPYNPLENEGFVNPPVLHASTVLFPSIRGMRERTQRYTYGRQGTPTSVAVTEHLAELEGADGVLLTPSGLAAISTTLLALLKTGDHVLVTDSAYKPIRAFCDGLLQRLGISITYYNPLIGAEISDLFQPNTTLVIVEAPGSLSFEVQDLPAISAAAHAKGAKVMVDNTWATPLFYKPLDLGADVAIQAATKYIVGHSDALVGTISAKEPIFSEIKAQYNLMGQWCGPDDMYFAHRGLRTLELRLTRHMESTLKVAKVLQDHPMVTRVRYPALEEDPGHAIWKRDFTGATGLLGLDLLPGNEEHVGAFLDDLTWFGLGYSWGGFESLALYANQQIVRTATPFDQSVPLVRLHIGLEDPDDLIEDLLEGLDRYQRAIGR